ncbi:kinetoplast-associated protein [Tritrichomonas foetus]|uniref:Kinetoplast-associated protein n=1 Tax=Tritrichomonas foetus TaxID=1144522 RepID=A0A1J4JXT6_9EUKA|nr:kinetoplast-associated protein [Tritrichomonas foetus]|eukprot:OHT03272.1 kinetoplast-associated protein [Tritrichomonas foetus]
MKAGSSSIKKTELERLHAEADTILTQKADEISQLNKTIDDAEKQLLSIKAELAAQIKNTEIVNNEDEATLDRELLSQEILDLKAQQDAELQNLQQAHEARLREMNESFQKSVHSAEFWAEQHANSIAADKMNQLTELQRTLETLKNSTTESLLSVSKTKYNSLQQSKRASYMNQQRIKVLETQIAEITAVTREEARDIKTKIEECLTSIELRGKEHETEIKRYQAEMDEREYKYNEHIRNLLEQFEVENKRMESAIASASSQADYLPKVIRQMEKQNEFHIQTSLKDLEKVKSTLYQSQTRDEKEQTETKQTVTQVQSIQRNQRRIEQEIFQIESEIKELDTENEQLKIELARLDQTVYR